MTNRREIHGIVLLGFHFQTTIEVIKYTWATRSFQPYTTYMAISPITDNFKTYENIELAVMMTGMEYPDSTFVDVRRRYDRHHERNPVNMYVEKSLSDMADLVGGKGRILRKGRLFEDG